MIIALAGRRVDADDAEQARFPKTNIEIVSQRIEQMLKELKCEYLFCSGACGVDLLALSAAGKLGIERRMILPFHSRQFRSTSVVDCPGKWGSIFDQIYNELDSKGSIISLDLDPDNDSTYPKTNEAIIAAAIEYSREHTKQSVNALVAWNGYSYGEEDMTNLFRQQATNQGLKVYEVMTI
jgi:hypothetical protein